MLFVPYFPPPPPPPPPPPGRKTPKSMPKFQFNYDNIPPTVESTDSSENSRKIAWHLTFEKQEMADFVRMTNGMDTAMQLGIPIEINLPNLKKGKSLLHAFRSREANDPYNPQRKVILTVHLPSEPELIYVNESIAPPDLHSMAVFDRCQGRKADIFVRPKLDALIQCYFFRSTLLSATQSASALGSPSVRERILLSTVFYQPYVDIRKKLAELSQNRGIWIKVSRLYPFHPAPSSFDAAGASESTAAWIVLAVVSVNMQEAILRS